MHKACYVTEYWEGWVVHSFNKYFMDILLCQVAIHTWLCLWSALMALM